jgi:formylglycine-generating enzyme required for sulfatase activity
MTNCGPGGSGTESCCTSPEIAGGAFYRTYPPGNTANGDEDPATVSGYRLDDYLVTVGRFRQFVSAVLPADGGAGWSPPAGSGKHTHLNGGSGLANVGTSPADGGLVHYEPGWVASDDANVSPTTTNLTTPGYCADSPTWTSASGSQENLPINCVNWWEAYAFCIWDGGFLPSEAEWEFAAAGGSQQRAYPWGSTDPGTSNQYAIYACDYPNGAVNCLQTVANIAPVGTAALGVGAFGQLDLVGDVWEWTLDWYAPFVVPCTDCADLTGGGSRVNRGGDFADTTERVVVPNREGWSDPSLRNRYYGFRCARAP